jgi:hypothetical protein
MQVSGGLVSTEWTEDLVFDQELRHRFGTQTSAMEGLTFTPTG